GRDLAIEHEIFSSPSAHEHGDAIVKIAGGEQEAVLGRPLDRIAERSDAARDDRYFVYGIDARKARGHERMAHLVIGDAAAFLLAQHPAPFFETGDGPLDRS